MDNQWRKKFEDAQVPPPDALWNKIAGDLDSGKKRGAFFPPFLGWAATIVAVLISGIMVYQEAGRELPLASNSMASSNVAINNQESEFSRSEQQSGVKESLGTNEVAESHERIQTTRVAKKEKKKPKRSSDENNKMTDETASNNAMAYSSSENTINPNESVSMLYTSGEVTLDETDYENETFNEKPIQEKFEYPSAEDLGIDQNYSVVKEKRKMWVGVSQGVGGFSNQVGEQVGVVGQAIDDPTFTLERALNSVQNDPQTLDEQLTMNTALLLGVPIGDKLSIVTGFSYNRSNFTSEAVAVDGELLHFTAETVSLNSDVTLNSFEAVNLKGSYDMAVMPIFADWQIISGNLNWSIQAGPEVGFLIQQQIRNDALGLSRTTGTGGLYEPFHLRVAIGTTITYGLNNHFQMSFQPLFEQAVTSITSPDASFESKPVYYSALFGLRYKF